ncbi:MAG: CHAT domain-containing protein, partial [Acidobacteriota bacterium]
MPPSNAPEASVPKSSVTKPIVLLAFANDRNDRARYLRNLPEERRRVRAALEPALAAGLCDVVELAGATVGDLLDAFQDPAHRGRIALFHFGGHAGSAELLFESAEGTPAAAHAGGLASFLGAVEGLELVFLNGCSSDGQVEGLLGAGVSAVVATSQAIDDRLATELSARFYGALGAGTTLTAAFEEAKAAVRTHVGDRPDDAYRSFLPETAAVERPWPWDLHLAEGAAERAAQWSLGAAAGDPLYGLPPVADEGLPEAPYPLLTPYTAADAPILFGRGAEIRRLYDRLTHPDAETLQLVYGAGGVGKSSLLAAGLAPRLRATRDVVYVRREAHRALAETFAEALGDGPLDGERQGGEASTFGERWRAREARSGRPLVVIVDQAEEGWNRPGPRELRAVGGALQELAATPPRGQLVLGFRSEWLAECLHLLDLLGIPRG